MQKDQRLRPEVIGFKPYTPGLGIEEIKEEYGLSTVIKLASNENPLGASPMVKQAVHRFAAHSFRYPQSNSPRLRAKLAETLGVSSACLVVGNGSDELIDLLIRTTLRPAQENMVVFRPSFSLYRLQAHLCGVEVRQAPLQEDMGFDFQALLDLVDAHTGLVFITNPDNPSGYAVKAEQLKALARDLPEGCLLVVDEAYIEFADDDLSPLKSWRETDKIVLLRTFSKIYGMAGLRLGYGLMPPWLAEALLRVKLPFSVNILAEQAGIAALKDHLFYDQTRQTVLKGRADLYTGLERLGCQVLPSQANFLFFRTPIPAQGVFEQLLSQGIIIRPLASYGLKDALRVSVGTTEENNCFLKALKEVLAHG